MNFSRQQKINNFLFVLFIIISAVLLTISICNDYNNRKVKSLEDDKSSLIYENKELKKQTNYLNDTYDDWEQSMGEKLGYKPIFQLEGIDAVKNTTILTVKDTKYNGEYIIITNGDRSFMQIIERKK